MEDRMYLPLMDGKKAAMPRYYKLKIYDDDERSIIADAMLYKAGKQFEKLKRRYGDKLNQALEGQRKQTFVKAAFKNISNDKL